MVSVLDKTIVKIFILQSRLFTIHRKKRFKNIVKRKKKQHRIFLKYVLTPPPLQRKVNVFNVSVTFILSTANAFEFQFGKALTLCLTRNFRLHQTERVCRRQF